MTLLLIHAVATWFMTGLIWFVQVVHYPLMARVGSEGYRTYQLEHERRTTWVVMPVMMIELGCAVWLLFDRPEEVPGWLVSVGLGLLAVVWLSTACLQVPCHRQLESGFDAGIHRRLVATNWIRTVCWSLRAVLAGGMLTLAC